MQQIPLPDARRIALAAQGFARKRPPRPGRAHLRAVIHRLGLLQMDFVNVLVPAHYLIPFSRLGPYDRGLLDRLLYRSREFTEQWAHEASIIPVSTWPLLRHRMAAHRPRPWIFGDIFRKHAGYADMILDLARERGPLLPEHLELPPDTGIFAEDAWFKSLPKMFLEAHFGFGRLAVAGRLPNFARTYDLAERVIPAQHHSREISPHEAGRELIRRAAVAYGIATTDDLADYYRMPVKTARAHVHELAAAGEIEEVRVESWRAAAWLHQDAPRPRRIDAAALLSPFDPVVWYRPRAARLFHFDYRIEIYTPKEKRRYGYYVLPFLFHESLAARVDLKAERPSSTLQVLSAHLESDQDADEVAGALARELRAVAEWLSLERITAPRKGPLGRALAAALKA